MLGRGRRSGGGVLGGRPVVRTAAVAGTAAVAVRGVRRRGDRREDRRDDRGTGAKSIVFPLADRRARNSGNSTAPHLHFGIQDGPSGLSNSLPFEIDRLVLEGHVVPGATLPRVNVAGTRRRLRDALPLIDSVIHVYRQRPRGSEMTPIQTTAKSAPIDEPPTNRASLVGVMRRPPHAPRPGLGFARLVVLAWCALGLVVVGSALRSPRRRG